MRTFANFSHSANPENVRVSMARSSFAVVSWKFRHFIKKQRTTVNGQ
jgi:hypothetical protein